MDNGHLSAPGASLFSARNLGGGVAESRNAPVAPGEVQGSRPAATAENILAAERRRPPHQRKWWRSWFFIFEPRDLWIGVFFSPEKFDESSGDFVRRTYFALIPTVVLVHQRWKAGAP